MTKVACRDRIGVDRQLHRHKTHQLETIALLVFHRRVIEETLLLYALEGIRTHDLSVTMPQSRPELLDNSNGYKSQPSATAAIPMT